MSYWNSEEDARKQIRELVTQYYRDYKKPLQEKPFVEGSRIPYASRVYDEKEMCGLVDAALDFWLTAGRFTEEFEKKLSEYLGVKYFGESECVYGAYFAPSRRAKGEKGR